MREIKFRAYWKPKDYEWEEDHKPRIIYFDEIGYCDEYNNLSFGLTKASRNPDGGGYNNLGADIDDMVVMQYTGLKDKNGKEIYEGDILKNYRGEEGINAEVYFDRGNFRVRGEKFSGGFDCVWWMDDESEIIGNIYENPELLTSEVKQ